MMPRKWEAVVDVIAPALDRYHAPPQFIVGLARGLLGLLQEAECSGKPIPHIRVVERPGALEIYVNGEFIGGYAATKQINSQTVPR